MVLIERANHSKGWDAKLQPKGCMEITDMGCEVKAFYSALSTVYGGKGRRSRSKGNSSTPLYFM
jgi:hypothetical protein